MALIFVNGEGENVIGIHAGANAALSPALVEAQRERIANALSLIHIYETAGLKNGLLVRCLVGLKAHNGRSRWKIT